jgi:anti-sigma regulatory factor (Ser/Thr protein kinase)
VHLSLQMPVQLDAIDAMVEKLRLAAGPLLSAEALFGFEVAVSEALTNCVKHAFDGVKQSSAATIEVTLSSDDSFATVEIFDQGRPGPADLLANVPRLEDIDIFAEHGRGLALILHYSDQASFTADRQGNHLRLRFKLSGPAQLESE